MFHSDFQPLLSLLPLRPLSSLCPATPPFRLPRHFQTKDRSKLRHFLGIEVAQSNNRIIISQRKYALDILDEIGLVNSKPIDSPMDPNSKFLSSQGEPLPEPEKYKRLVGKFSYLIVTHSEISFAVNVVSQFLNSPCTGRWNAIKKFPWKRFVIWSQ